MTLEDTSSWKQFTSEELRDKLAALQDLVDSGTLTDRSAEQQRREIGIIEYELATRDGG